MFVYLDDILVASSDEDEHKKHLREVLRKLRDNGMAINVSKCVLGQSAVKYLGQEISCLLYTSPSPRDLSTSRMPSSA